MSTAPGGLITVTQALTRAQALGLDRLDAQLLLLHALGRGESERAWLLAHDTDTLPNEQVSAFAALCQRRLAGEPVAYLLGHKEFWGLPLTVDARVLVPRPDTETLVEWALEVVDTMGVPEGTGTGADPPPPVTLRPPAAQTAPRPVLEMALKLAHRCSTWAPAAVPSRWPWRTPDPPCVWLRSTAVPTPWRWPGAMPRAWGWRSTSGWPTGWTAHLPGCT